MNNFNSKLKQNIIYSVAYQSLAVVYPLFMTPLISKAFGAELLGIYSFTYSIAYYFSLFAGLGIHTYGTRLIAMSRENKKETQKNFSELYFIQLVFSLVTIIFYILYVLFFQKKNIEISLLQGIIILTAMVDISWFLSGMEQFKPMVLRNTFIKIFSLLLVLKLVDNKEDLKKYIMIISITNLLGQLSVWTIITPYFSKIKISFNEIKKHIFPIIKLFLPIIALNAHVLIDKVMLGLFRTMTEVGYYENCDKLIKMPIGLSCAATAALIPRAAYYVKNGKRQKNNDTLIKTLYYNYLLVFPIIFLLIFMSSELVPWYLGEEFIDCIKYIQLLAPVIFFMVTNYILRMQYFIALNKDKEYIFSIVFSTLINIFFNLLTIQRWGIYGVILSTILSELLSCVYLILKSKEDLSYHKIFFEIILILLSSFPMIIVLQFVGKKGDIGIINSLKQGIIGFLVYFTIYTLIYFIRGKIREKFRNVSKG